MKYIIHFNGRLCGAIGQFSFYTETVEAENEEKAIMKLYDKYDHVTQITINGQRYFRK